MRIIDISYSVIFAGLGVFTFLNYYAGQYYGLFWKDFFPYEEYYKNSVIESVNIGAISIDIAVFSLFVFRVKWDEEDKELGILFSLLSMIIFLTWFELFYASSFYYREMSDKQAYPFTLNNLGPIGSCFSSVYIVIQYIRKNLEDTEIWVRSIVYVGSFLLLLLLHEFVLEWIREIAGHDLF
ncbi:hypothetical protein [Leptospira perolatii]|nr:hypothetical protein [Leptospira perolatii]